MGDKNTQGQFQIKLEGSNAVPSNFSLNEMYYLLRDFQDALKYEAGFDEFDKSDIDFSLVSLEKKCVLYTCEYEQPKTGEIADKIFASLSGEYFADLGYKTLKKLNDFQNRLLNKEVYSEFLVQGTKVAEITDKTRISVQDIEIKDHTTIYAEIERVGGSKPSVRLRLLNGEAVTVNTSKEIAKKISNHLYALSGLVGVATWNKLDYSLLDFKINDIIEMEEKPYTEVFDELRDIFAPKIDKYDDINDILLRD